MTVCGGKTRAGGGCTRPAGWGTDHVGTGRCKLHGGGIGTGRPIIHGRYSTKRLSLYSKLEQFYNDPAAGDLRSELALLRALLQEQLDHIDRKKNITSADITIVYNMVDNIGRLVERIAKILTTTALTQVELQLLQAAMIDALSEFIPDPERQRAFVSRIFGTIRGVSDAGPTSHPAVTDIVGVVK